MGRTAGSERRGAVIIETALVAPLLLVIVLGIVEMALLMRDDNALSSLVEEGGRHATSALRGEAVPFAAVAEHCSAACSRSPERPWTDAVATAIGRTQEGLSKDAVDELWVYKANAQGYPGGADNTSFGACDRSCVAYRWNAARGSFEYVRGSWPGAEADVCAAEDAVGVYVRATHPFLSGVLSEGVHISDHAVFSFSPASCSSVRG
jgi:hypothetical protein